MRGQTGRRAEDPGYSDTAYSEIRPPMLEPITTVFGRRAIHRIAGIDARASLR